MDTMAVKEQICDVCHKMWQLTRDLVYDGNVSVKMGDGTWWITPSGISKSFITPDNLIRVDSSMCVVEGPEGYRPSSEMKMHMRCYAEREDAGGSGPRPSAHGDGLCPWQTSPWMNIA